MGRDGHRLDDDQLVKLIEEELRARQLVQRRHLLGQLVGLSWLFHVHPVRDTDAAQGDDAARQHQKNIGGMRRRQVREFAVDPFRVEHRSEQVRWP
jgi:hypothetical protein